MNDSLSQARTTVLNWNVKGIGHDSYLDQFIGDLMRSGGVIVWTIISSWRENRPVTCGMLIGTTRDVFSLLHQMKNAGDHALEFSERHHIKLRNIVDLARLMKRHLGGNLSESEVCRLLVDGDFQIDDQFEGFKPKLAKSE